MEQFNFEIEIERQEAGKRLSLKVTWKSLYNIGLHYITGKGHNRAKIITRVNHTSKKQVSLVSEHRQFFGIVRQIFGWERGTH